MSKTMYFGSRERMTFVKAPATGMSSSREKWSVNGVYLNGGGFQRNSAYSHAKYSLAWNLMSPDEVREIMDYYNGKYGQGAIYFLDAFAIRGNVLPLHWSVPRLTVEDAPSFIKNYVPTLVPLAAPNNAGNYPTASAVYEQFTADYTSDSVWIPVPPGQNFYFGYTGNRTGSMDIVLTGDDGTVVVDSTPIPSSNSVRTNMVLTNPGGVTITLAGAGSLTLNSMTGMVGTEPPANDDFQSGEGHAGAAFDGAPSKTGYSAAIGKGLEALSADFIEVGAWQ